jgi:hypothetical protein
MIGDRLRETLYFFRANAGALAAVTLPFAALAAGGAHLLGEPVAIEEEQAVFHWEAALLLTVLYPLALAVKLLAVHALAGEGRLPPPARLLSLALQRWAPLLGVSVVIALAMGIGLYLFVLPGIWIYARLGFAPLLAVLEGMSPDEALRASWRMSQPLQHELMGVAFLLGGGVILVMLTVFQLIAGAGAEESPTADLLARALGEWLFCLPSIAFYRYWSLARQPT